MVIVFMIYTPFNKIDGVNLGDKIMISGINIGYVDEINLKDNYPDKNEN